MKMIGKIYRYNLSALSSQLSALCILLFAVCLSACNDKLTDDAVTTAPEIKVTTSLDQTKTVTRANLYDSDNLTENRMNLYVSYSDTKTSYFNIGVLYDEDNEWKFYSAEKNVKGLKYFWPTSGTLDFFAYFAKNSKEADLKTKVTTAPATPSITYAGTSPINEESQADQNEYIFAYSRGVGPGSDGNVDLAFHRPFSLVAFKLNESIRCTIASIKITGIYNNGTATLSTADPYATWTPSGTTTNIEVDYSTMAAYSANGGIRYPGDINSGTDLCVPFITVPQTIPDDAKIEVTYKAVGSANNTTVKSTLKAATLADNSQVTVWKPGNRYDYSLTLNGAANEIFVAVTVNDWQIEGSSETEVK